MSAADVSVTFELEVLKDKWRSDLAEMRADFEQFKTQAAGTAIEIPARIRDEATGQLRSLMGQLQAEAAGGITIPVNMGGGAAGGFPMAAGALPMPLIPNFEGNTLSGPRLRAEDFGAPSTAFAREGVSGSGGVVGALGLAPELGAYGDPFRAMQANRTLGTQSFTGPSGARAFRTGIDDLAGAYPVVTPMGLEAAAGFGGPNVMTASGVMPMTITQAPLVNEMRATSMASTIPQETITQEGFFRANPYAEISSFPSMTLEQRLARNAQIAGAEGGGAGMLGRGIRGMTLAFLAIKGIEGAYQASEDRGIMGDAAGDSDSAEGARRMARTLRSERSLFFGLPSLFRDIGERLSGGSSTSDVIDDLDREGKHNTAVTRSMAKASHLGRLLREEGFTDASGTFAQQTMANEANFAESSLGGGSNQAYAKIDEEHEKQLQAIRKRAEHLHEQGVAEGLITAEMNSLVASSARVADARRMGVMRHEAAQIDISNAMNFEASGDFGGAMAIRRGLRDVGISQQFGDTPAGRQRIGAAHALDLSEDRLRASEMQSEISSRSLRFGGDVVGATRAEMLNRLHQDERSDPMNPATHLMSAIEGMREAINTDSGRTADFRNKISELGIDSPFEQQRFAARAGSASSRFRDPARAAMYKEYESAELSRINRSEQRSVDRLRHEAQEITVATGADHRFADARGASAMFALLHRTQESLQEASGEGDSGRRAAIREYAAAEANRMLVSESDPRVRQGLQRIAAQDYEGRDPHSTTPPVQSGHSANAGSPTGELSEAIKQFIAYLRSAGHAVIVDE